MIRSLIVLAAGVLLACGSTGGLPAHEIAATDAQNGQSIAIHVGDTVRLTLNSTEWTVENSSDPTVVKQEGVQVVSPAPRGACLPGMGCGTTTALFKAVKSGTATVRATRGNCGEARRCVGAEGQYQLTVVVS